MCSSRATPTGSGSSPGQHHTDAGPLLDIIDVHPDRSDTPARELSGREDRGTQADLPSRGHNGGIMVRRGDVIVMGRRRYRMTSDFRIPMEADVDNTESVASQTTETSGLNFHERWSLHNSTVGFDTDGNHLARIEVTHTFSCPTRVLQMYGGPYNQFYVPTEYAPNLAFGGIIPPGARPPLRFPTNNPAAWEDFFERHMERHAEGL
ncbi:hypothetical protein HOLleu_16462 [Holothuria leucospilota]|uniref:Uncharacterized protein n=1 Tax=Holothuria leucospilota TaxID=206669 RepID=A0A9Q1C5T1_HOLLE|nr:hypothetical protein HOLleu_16462 [Holothuria leucospilota]